MFENNPGHSDEFDEQKELLSIISKGVTYWNQWRLKFSKFNPHFKNADFTDQKLEGINFKNSYLGGADFSGSDLQNVNFKGAYLAGSKFNNANLSNSALRGTNIINADFSHSKIQNADIRGANFRKAKLINTNLSYSNLTGSNLTEVDLSNADLSYSSLRYCTFIRSCLDYCNLSNARVYGVSVWDCSSLSSTQNNLIITDSGNSEITLDNIELAQFIYLMLNNEKLREIIDTVSSKAILILGRFSEERKKVLDDLRKQFRELNFIPILFDFNKPSNRDLTETISTLAHMSKFIIVDLTDAKAIPQELMAIVPNLPSVNVQPIISKDSTEFTMFEHFAKFPWVLPIIEYEPAGKRLSDLIQQIMFRILS